jgi:hypothetical protein
MVISDEVRLAVSLALFALAGIIFYRFSYHMAWDQWVRSDPRPHAATRRKYPVLPRSASHPIT